MFWNRMVEEGTATIRLHGKNPDILHAYQNSICIFEIVKFAPFIEKLFVPRILNPALSSFCLVSFLCTMARASLDARERESERAKNAMLQIRLPRLQS
jgi:hypothetical protein